MWEKLSKLLEPETSHQDHRRCVLVIDDGLIERRVVAKTFEKHGYRVLAAANGVRGIELAKQETPDAIILDYIMPGLNGAEVCAILKNTETTRHIPIIILTGSSRPWTVIECYERGADYYLNKPIDASILIKQVEVCLSERPLFTSV